MRCFSLAGREEPPSSPVEEVCPRERAKEASGGGRNSWGWGLRTGVALDLYLWRGPETG